MIFFIFLGLLAVIATICIVYGVVNFVAANWKITDIERKRKKAELDTLQAIQFHLSNMKKDATNYQTLQRLAETLTKRIYGPFT